MGILQPPGPTVVDLALQNIGDLVSAGQKVLGNENLQALAQQYGASEKSIDDLANESGSLSKSIQATVSKYIVKIGNYILIPWAIVSRIEPSFSNEIDDYGFPISGKLSLEISSAQAMSKQELDKWYNGISKSSVVAGKTPLKF